MSKPVTPADAIRRLREVEAKATPGPWSTRGTAAVSNRYPGCSVSTGNRCWFVVDGEGRDRNAANARMIAFARNALPALLDVVEAARELRRCEPMDDDAHELVEARERFDAALAAFAASMEHKP